MDEAVIITVVCLFCVGAGMIIGASWGMNNARNKEYKQNLRKIWESGVEYALNNLLSYGVLSDSEYKTWYEHIIRKI